MKSQKDNSYYSHGKLLLTAEYYVLAGAKAIALPTKFGQSLNLSTAKGNRILSWKAKDPNGIWFEGEFEIPNLKTLKTSNDDVSSYLIKILNEVKNLNPTAFNKSLSYYIETDLEFNKEWGLGSSSTLISNLASHFNISPYELNFKTFKSSGFDIACASSDGPIIYQLENERPIVNRIDINYPFKNQLFFVYLGEEAKFTREYKKFQLETKNHKIRY
jgi:mevalonate kinase